MPSTRTHEISGQVQLREQNPVLPKPEKTGGGNETSLARETLTKSRFLRFRQSLTKITTRQ